MKRIVKLNLILLIMISMIFCIAKSSYAALSSKVTISSASEVKRGKEFAVNFNLSSLQSDKGVNALMGTLKYDEDSLTLVKMEGQNSWSNPSYNEANGAFIMDKDEYATTDEAFMKVTFKVKEESKENVNISIEKISVSNEDEEIDVSSTSKSIKVKGDEQTPDTNTNTNSGTNVNSNKNNSSNGNTNINSNKTNSSTSAVKNGTLPDTGNGNTGSIICIGMFATVTTLVIFCTKNLDFFK